MPDLVTLVVPLMDSWEFTRNIDGFSGVRKYIDAAARTEITPEELPSIGDSWDSTYFSLVCKNIRTTYLGDRNTCYQIYECQYDSLPADTNSQIENSQDELPTGVELAANIQTYDNIYTGTSGEGDINQLASWRWTTNSSGNFICGSIAQDMLRTKIEINMGFTVSRYIAPTDLGSFILNTQRPLLGRVNQLSFYGIPPGCALYLGSTAEKVGIDGFKKKYKLINKFQLKFAPLSGGGGYGGWNYIINPLLNQYNVPLFGKQGETYNFSTLAGDALPLYEYADFTPLMTAAKPSIDFSKAPTK